MTPNTHSTRCYHFARFAAETMEDCGEEKYSVDGRTTLRSWES